MSLICQQLYGELEELKKKLEGMDFNLGLKYDMEKNRNAELLREIEIWKNRYTSSEKSKSKELEDLRLQMESNRKSMLDREIRELTLKFQSERGMLESEIRKQRENINNRDR